MNYALIEDNTAVAVSKEPYKNFHQSLAEKFVQVPDEVCSGWQLVNSVWKSPEEPVLSWSNAPAEYWWVDVGPFMDRFNGKALSVVSSTDPLVQGVITLLIPRQYVDLKRQDLPAILDLLISKGLLNEQDKQEILFEPTTDYERHIKGLPQPTGA